MNKNSKQSQPPLQFLAILSVAMVVITIGAAFGVLSGRGAMIGMISAALMTMVTGFVGGSRYGVSSPTGPMTAALAVILLMDQNFLQTHHHPELDPVMLMNLTVMLAGVLLLTFALLRLHRCIQWVPQLVISGFINGIAVLILISQLVATEGMENWILLSVTFLASMGISRLSDPSHHLVWRILYSSFGVLVVMSAVAYLFQFPINYVEFEGALHAISFSLPAWSLVSFDTLGIIIPLAIELAVIALLDTLLTSIILDERTGTKTQHVRELSGQSLSFLGVSLFGGIPGAKSTVPSIMMLEEKNHHPWSKVFLGIFCLLLAVVFADFIQYIPSAVFGGLIIKIACDVADLTALRAVLQSDHHYRHAQLFLILAVLFSTVFISLNLAVIGCTLFFVIWNASVPKKWTIPDLVKDKESEGLLDEI